MRMSILHLPLPLYPPISHLTSTQSNLPSSPNFYVLCQMDKTSMVLIRKVSHNFIVRRSANYRPPIWKHEFIQSLKSEFMEERCFNKRNMLIRRLKMMLNKELLIGDSLKGLEVVDELKRWWKSTGLGEKLEFARDRLMANFFWSVGMGCEPHLGYLRTMSTKIASLITIIDDVYDVYGTLDELELFTDVVERWDIAAIDSLPNYMKICFIALHNTINDMTFHAAKDHGVNVIQYFKKMWIDLCKKAFLVEAKWYYTNYKPTFQEYLDNAWISVSGSLLLLHAYVFATNSITIEALECLQDYPHIIQHSSVIFCLANDLASSSEEAKRGEVTKSIQCYMNDTGASEQEARRCIKDFIMESWKKMNEEVQTLNSSPLFSKGFIEIALNLARVSHTVYQHRDGHTVEDYETMDRVLSLFIEPA
ncbi:terpene synthase 10-like isoform X2 [Benincasa hispida]|uniref:terpene synthase 10-like isoform X2 n=1 Tax=Benincasa hispida TaxID=102211 RepID=UPI0018FFDDAB|nr:terpene synthase 10-like isoform X2 [Benincasa hispida]